MTLLVECLILNHKAMSVFDKRFLSHQVPLETIIVEKMTLREHADCDRMSKDRIITAVFY